MLSDKARESAFKLVDQLGSNSSISPSSQIDVLRTIKNGIIGNKTKKDLYISLNIIPKLVEFLKNKDLSLQLLSTQAAIILGSLAYGSPDIVQLLVSCEAIPTLLSCLKIDEARQDLVEASLRALKAILQLPDIDASPVYDSHNLENLLLLLKPQFTNVSTLSGSVPTLYTAELVSLIIARSCTDTPRQNLLAKEGVIELLVKLLLTDSVKAQEAALEALSALCNDNLHIGFQIKKYRGPSNEFPMVVLFDLVRSSNQSMQLAAATCLTNMSRSNSIPEYSKQIICIVLHTLIKLLSSTGSAQIEAPLILTYLVRDNEIMQKAACEADAVCKLVDIISRLSSGASYSELSDYQSHDKNKLEEYALLALAAVSTHKEECRKQVIEAKALPHIVSAMAHPKFGIRAAACLCTRSLSRSVLNLRTSLLDAGIAEPLFKLLDDESTVVQNSALATLCNIVLDFSSMKKHIIDNGGVNKLISLVDSSNQQLRLNAVWALKNLLFQAETNDKAEVMDRLSYKKLYSLINDEEQSIQEQALGLLRNLSCGKDLVVCNLFSGIGPQKFINLIEEKLKSDSELIITPTLYIIVNVATGTTDHKTALMDSKEILSSIHKFMTHSSSAIRTAAVWCLINLTWTDDSPPGSDCLSRIRKFRGLGFEKTLKALQSDNSLDVKDRAKTALLHFKSEMPSHETSRFGNYSANTNSIPRVPTDEDMEDGNEDNSSDSV